MNKIKALFGDWTSSFYSCDSDSFDSYLMQYKKLPSENSDLVKDIAELWRVSEKPPYASEVSFNGSTFLSLKKAHDQND